MSAARPGLWLLAHAGVVVMAASIGNIDGQIQATGAQLANDLVGEARPHATHPGGEGRHGAGDALSAWLACLGLPALFTIAILAYQGVIQLAVPQFLGLFWKRGNYVGAIAGMTVGLVPAIVLEYFYPMYLPWAYAPHIGSVCACG